LCRPVSPQILENNLAEGIPTVSGNAIFASWKNLIGFGAFFYD